MSTLSSRRTQYTKISDLNPAIPMVSVIVIIDRTTLQGEEVEVGDASGSIILKVKSDLMRRKLGIVDDSPEAVSAMVLKNVFPIVDGHGRLVLYLSDMFTEVIGVEKMQKFSRNRDRNLSSIRYVRRGYSN